MSSAPADLEPLLQRGFRYALALTHDRELARDLVQDACVRVVRRDGPWTVAYVLTAVRSAWIDRARRDQRRPVDPAPDGAIEHAQVAAQPPRDDALDAALHELRPEERELLYLAVVEGHTAADLARRTGSPRGTILSRLHRTKEKLRALLAGRRFEVDA